MYGYVHGKDTRVNFEKINIGTEAIVIRDDIIEEINSVHKSTWDILTGIGRRVYRVYKKNGTPYLITR